MLVIQHLATFKSLSIRYSHKTFGHISVRTINTSISVFIYLTGTFSILTSQQSNFLTWWFCIRASNQSSVVSAFFSLSNLYSYCQLNEAYQLKTNSDNLPPSSKNKNYIYIPEVHAFPQKLRLATNLQNSVFQPDSSWYSSHLSTLDQLIMI